MAVRRAEADLEIAVAEAENEFKILASEKAAAAAKAELRRAEESAEKYAKSISATELDRLRLIAERSDLELAQAKYERHVAKLNAAAKRIACDDARRELSLHQIVAPADGVVVEVRRRAGEWVEPGMPVVRVVKLDSLRVEAFVAAKDAAKLRVGMPIRFLPKSLPGDDMTTSAVAGVLAYVSPEIDPVNGQVRVRAELQNRDLALRPGLEGTIEVLAAPPAKPAASKKPVEVREWPRFPHRRTSDCGAPRISASCRCRKAARRGWPKIRPLRVSTSCRPKSISC
ncbi:MAG: efflux RND transporter periplasmic adaptor subunit [Pirellulales bacterium]